MKRLNLGRLTSHEKLQLESETNDIIYKYLHGFLPSMSIKPGILVPQTEMVERDRRLVARGSSYLLEQIAHCSVHYPTVLSGSAREEDS